MSRASLPVATSRPSSPAMRTSWRTASAEVQLLAEPAPEGVLVAAAGVQAHGDRHRVDRQDVAHDALERQRRAVRHPADELHHRVRVGAVEAAADGHPGEVERAGVDAAADQPLHGLQLRGVGELEVRLDAVGGQPLAGAPRPTRGRPGPPCCGRPRTAPGARTRCRRCRSRSSARRCSSGWC